MHSVIFNRWIHLWRWTLRYGSEISLAVKSLLGGKAFGEITVAVCLVTLKTVMVTWNENYDHYQNFSYLLFKMHSNLTLTGSENYRAWNGIMWWMISYRDYLLSTEANTNFPTANSKAWVPHWSHHPDEIPAVFFAWRQTSSSCHQVGISKAQSHGVRREDLGSRRPSKQGREAWEVVAVVAWGWGSSQLLWNGRKLDLRSSCKVSSEAARGLFLFLLG